MLRTISLAKLRLFSEEDAEVARILRQLQDEASNITVTNGTVYAEGSSPDPNEKPSGRSTPLAREKVYSEEDEEVSRILKLLQNESSNITVSNGTVQSVDNPNGTPSSRSTPLAREKVYAWYNVIDKDGSQRGKQSLQFEYDMLEKFKKEQGPENFWYKAQFREDGKFEVIFIIRFRLTKYSEYQRWTFQMVYGDNYGAAQDVSSRGLNAEFGGAIQVYPIDPPPAKLKRGDRMFHHLVHDGNTGRYFLCRMKSAATNESSSSGGSQLHAYKALQNVLRWLTVYNIWQKTGRDIDAE